MKTTMVDPPSGWKYGFPKALPNPLPQPWSLTLWLISEGYPEIELAKHGDFFQYVRMWEVDNEDPNDTDKVARRGYD
tara:strand:+ start:323 stop:553 length:231 start_codon:yes stop_codon:yes gene_type:complete